MIFISYSQIFYMDKKTAMSLKRGAVVTFKDSSRESGSYELQRDPVNVGAVVYLPISIYDGRIINYDCDMFADSPASSVINTDTSKIQT